MWLLWEWERCARVDGVWVGNEVGVGQFRDAGELGNHLLALGRVLASSKCTSTLAKKNKQALFSRQEGDGDKALVQVDEKGNMQNAPRSVMPPRTQDPKNRVFLCVCAPPVAPEDEDEDGLYCGVGCASG